MANQSNSEAELKLSVKGVIGIGIALTVLGGGALALTKQTIQIDNSSEGGSVGDININSDQSEN